MPDIDDRPPPRIRPGRFGTGSVATRRRARADLRRNHTIGGSDWSVAGISPTIAGLRIGFLVSSLPARVRGTPSSPMTTRGPPAPPVGRCRSGPGRPAARATVGEGGAEDAVGPARVPSPAARKDDQLGPTRTAPGTGNLASRSRMANLLVRRRGHSVRIEGQGDSCRYPTWTKRASCRRAFMTARSPRSAIDSDVSRGPTDVVDYSKSSTPMCRKPAESG